MLHKINFTEIIFYSIFSHKNAYFCLQLYFRQSRNFGPRDLFVTAITKHCRLEDHQRKGEILPDNKCLCEIKSVACPVKRICLTRL